MTDWRGPQTRYWNVASWVIILAVFGTAAVADEAPRQVRGLIVDDEGQSVADAKVMLYYHRSFTGFENEVVETVSSDKDGRFQFARELVYFDESHNTYTDYYVVLVQHAKYAVGWQQILSEDPPTELRIVLGKSHSQTFVLTSENAEPLEAAAVWLRHAGRRDDDNPAYRGLLSLPENVGFVTGKTDAKGRITLSNLPNTSCSFCASSVGYATEIAFHCVPSNAVKKGRLTKGTKVSGIVRTRDGRPLPGAVVWFQPEWIIGYYRYVKTGVDGRFEVADLFRQDPKGEPARYRVRVKHARFAAMPQELKLDPNVAAKPITFAAVRGTLVSGKVLEPGTDRPLPGARVQGQSTSGRLNAYADSRGEFSWIVAPGRVSARFTSPPAGVYVTRRGGLRTQATVQATGDEVQLTVYAPSKVLPLANLSGKLMLPDGTPAAGLTIHAVPTADFAAAGSYSYIHSTATNPDGSFTLKGVPTETSIGLYAETQDRKLALARLFKVAAHQVAFAEPLKLEKTKVSKAVISDAEGKPYKDMLLKVRPIIGSKWPLDYDREVMTDANGRLQANGLVLGLTYFVRDARAELHKSDWAELFHTNMVLVK